MKFTFSGMFPRLPFDLVAVGASAGGVLALRQVLRSLRANFPLPIAIVQHISPGLDTQLPRVIGWQSPLRTEFAAHGERLRAGRVYVAPPDRHLEVGRDGRLALFATPRCNYARPSVDNLFRSAASIFGARVLCVVLTGMGADGASGAAELKAGGSMVVVQDPSDSEAPFMPSAALRACAADLVLPLSLIPVALEALTVPGARELFRAGPERLCA